MDNESLWQSCSFPRAVAEKGELGGGGLSRGKVEGAVLEVLQ